MKGWFNAFWYYFHLLIWVRPVLAWASRRDVQGRENVPRHGALILCANHMNTGDPPLLTDTTPRRIAWLTKRELFEMPLFGLMYRSVGFIPVRRHEADLQALRKAQEVIRDGGVLGVFPEGTRSLTKSMAMGEPGAGLLALRTGAPVLPVAIWGTENVKLPRDLLRRTRVHIRFGKPFTLTKSDRVTRDAADTATDTIMRAIADLLPTQYRGAYAEPKKEREPGQRAPRERAPASSRGKK